MTTALWISLGCSLLAIAYGIYYTRWIVSLPAGNARMQEIAEAIQQGATAYLNRQYRSISLVGGLLFVLIGFALGWLSAFGFAVGASLT